MQVDQVSVSPYIKGCANGATRCFLAEFDGVTALGGCADYSCCPRPDLAIKMRQQGQQSVAPLKYCVRHLPVLASSIDVGKAAKGKCSASGPQSTACYCKGACLSTEHKRSCRFGRTCLKVCETIGSGNRLEAKRTECPLSQRYGLGFKYRCSIAVWSGRWLCLPCGQQHEHRALGR
jgi:hypothetical protein